MQMRFLQRSDGYTFVELLLTITILALFTAPLLGLLGTGFAAINSAGQQTAAVNLCRASLESAKSLGYAAVYNFYILEARSPVIEATLPGAPHLKRVTEVTTLPPDAGAALQGLELLQIRVTVYWTGKGAERSAALESYLAPR